MTTNSKQWQENSDGWVKATEESRKKKEERFYCNHGDFEWCDNCLITIDGEKLEPV